MTSDEYEAATAVLVSRLQALLTEALLWSGKRRTAIAREIGTSVGCISRSLRNKNMNLRTVARLLAASGFELRCELVRRGETLKCPKCGHEL